MDAASLYVMLTSRGFRLQADGNKVLVQPKEQLTDADRQLILDHKAALLQHMADPRGWEESAEGPRPGLAEPAASEPAFPRFVPDALHWSDAFPDGCPQAVHIDPGELDQLLRQHQQEGGENPPV